MPELPEVETVKRGLEPFLLGQVLTDIQIRSDKLRFLIPKAELKSLKNSKIISVTRRAKYILIDFEDKKTLISHLGMTGSFLVFPKKSINFPVLDRHHHVVLTLDNDTRIIYRDPRRFGLLDVVPSHDVIEHKLIHHLGPEPLDTEWTGQQLFDALRKRSGPIKTSLMDQKIVVGVGNIYASEALYLSKIHPEKPADTLTKKQCDAVVKVTKFILKKSIKNGGSTLQDYRHVGGDVGEFQSHFSVYDKEGEACPNCTCSMQKTGGIQRIVQSGRSSFFCPKYQKM
jgi:formamidopyrimidine-DNA glycosylase